MSWKGKIVRMLCLLPRDELTVPLQRSAPRLQTSTRTTGASLRAVMRTAIRVMEIGTMALL